jgi:hypothetical protein
MTELTLEEFTKKVNEEYGNFSEIAIKTIFDFLHECGCPPEDDGDETLGELGMYYQEWDSLNDFFEWHDDDEDEDNIPKENWDLQHFNEFFEKNDNVDSVKTWQLENGHVLIHNW